MRRKASNALVGIVVIGAGVMGSFHAESVANLPQPSLDEALSSLRVADAILRSLKGGKPVALQG
ncbi:MAG: hypothetical protein ACREE7_20145 [Dongiaceae bacterium]